jgi:hypothetical protein
MKGKKLGKQSQHVRVLSTKKGKKKVLVNPGHRRAKVKKRLSTLGKISKPRDELLISSPSNNKIAQNVFSYSMDEPEGSSIHYNNRAKNMPMAFAAIKDAELVRNLKQRTLEKGRKLTPEEELEISRDRFVFTLPSSEEVMMNKLRKSGESPDMVLKADGSLTMFGENNVFDNMGQLTYLDPFKKEGELVADNPFALTILNLVGQDDVPVEFGRWKGKKIKEVPDDYLRWANRETNVRINSNMYGDPNLGFIDVSKVTNFKNDERIAEQQKKFQQHLDKLQNDYIINSEIDKLNRKRPR